MPIVFRIQSVLVELSSQQQQPVSRMASPWLEIVIRRPFGPAALLRLPPSYQLSDRIVYFPCLPLFTPCSSLFLP